MSMYYSTEEMECGIVKDLSEKVLHRLANQRNDNVCWMCRGLKRIVKKVMREKLLIAAQEDATSAELIDAVALIAMELDLRGDND